MKQSLFETIFRHEQGYWWYVGRLAILKSLVVRAVLRAQGLKILNIGCGTGVMSQAFEEFGDVVTLDNSEVALEFCRRRGVSNLVQGEAEQLPFPDSSFDLALACDVLEHVEHDGIALAEIHRVLNSGGLAVLTVPAYQFMWSQLDDLGSHKRRYRLRELRAKLREAGFRIHKASYFNSLLFPLAVIERAWEHLAGKKVTDENVLPKVPPWLNRSLTAVFKFEASLLRHFDFPAGLSVLALATPKEP